MLDADDLIDLALDIVDIASDWLSYKVRKNSEPSSITTEKKPAKTAIQDPWEQQESPPWESEK